MTIWTIEEELVAINSETFCYDQNAMTQNNQVKIMWYSNTKDYLTNSWLYKVKNHWIIKIWGMLFEQLKV